MNCKHNSSNLATCGTCQRDWCAACDPSPSDQCHWCNGRGYALPVANVRFKWDGITITMQPGQRLTHHQGGPDDEGYWYKAVGFEYASDGSAVVAEVSSGGADCDGRLDNYADLILDLSNYRTRRAGFQLESESQRDQFAELAGY
jgi:hypothetical protein